MKNNFISSYLKSGNFNKAITHLTSCSEAYISSLSYLNYIEQFCMTMTTARGSVVVCYYSLFNGKFLLLYRYKEINIPSFPTLGVTSFYSFNLRVTFRPYS